MKQVNTNKIKWILFSIKSEARIEWMSSVKVCYNHESTSTDNERLLQEHAVQLTLTDFYLYHK